MSKEELTLSRIEIGGNKYEVIVDPYKAYEYKKGRLKDINEVLKFEEIFKDARKGERPTKKDLLKDFKTSDVREIAKIIVKNGRLQLTTRQRKEMIEANTKRIITYISKNFLDPRTGKPHPPQRIELALREASVPIDPFENYLVQAQEIISKIKAVLPLKPVQRKTVFLEIIVPTEFTGKVYGEIKRKGQIMEEKWEEGKLWIQVKTTSDLEEDLTRKLESVTKGKVRVRKVG